MFNLTEDFRSIPGFYGYSINHSGVVHSPYTNTYLRGARNPAGYMSFRLKPTPQAKPFTIGRHVLLCRTFKPKTGCENLMVNHKNGVKGDDRLGNLEWSTPKENVEHAGRIGLSPKCCPVQIRDSRTGEVKNFPSATECSAYLGLTKDYVLFRLRTGNDGRVVFSDYRQYRKTRDCPWFIPDNVEAARYESLSTTALEVKDLYTGEISVFEKGIDCCEHVGIRHPVLSTGLKKNSPSGFVYKNRYQIRKFSNAPWASVSVVCRIDTVILTTGERLSFDTLKQCAKFHSLPESTLSWKLKGSPQGVLLGNVKFIPVRVTGDRYVNSP